MRKILCNFQIEFPVLISCYSTCGSLPNNICAWKNYLMEMIALVLIAIYFTFYCFLCEK